MSANRVPIRLATLLDPNLTMAAKLVWLGLQMNEPNLKERERRSPTRLQKKTGVSRPTVRRALASLSQRRSGGSGSQIPNLHGIKIRVSPDLITNKSLSPLARVLYCQLLGLVRYKSARVLSSFKAIAQAVQMQPRTVSQGVRSLVDAGWLAISREHPRAPIHISFSDPKIARRNAEVRRARQRLEKSQYLGETLALLWCDSLVECKNYEDDYFPDAFTNPLTNELLQSDRYYFTHKVAIEFNGPQHEGPTLHYTAKQAESQMRRDKIKRQICTQQKIALITVWPEDLTLHRMHDLLGRVLPLRKFLADEPIFSLLESESKHYLKTIENIRRQSQAAAGPSNAPVAASRKAS